MVGRVCFYQHFLTLILTGTDLVTMSIKDQLAKTRKMDFETLENSNITINMTCEIKSRDFQEDFVTTSKLLRITVVDVNDNPVTVDEFSKKVEVFRSNWSYAEASYT